MLEWISWFIIGILNCIVDFIIFKKLLGCKTHEKLWKIFIIFIIYSLFSVIIIKNAPPLLRMLINLISTIIISKLIFKDRVTKITLITLLWFIGYAFSEVITITIMVLLMGINIEFLKEKIIGIFLINVIIMMFNYILFSIKFIKRIVNEIIQWYENKEVINNIVLIFITLVTTFFFIYQNYIGNLTKSDFLMTILFFLGIIIIIIHLFKEKTNNIKISTNYDQMLEYVKTYETVLEEKSKAQHEYKNQLLLIKSMIEEKEPNIIEEIDKRLKIKNNSKNYKWLEKLKNIPSGGLKGLIHYKINQMLDLGITVYVDIDDNVKSNKIKKMCNDNLEDISKILCIYIDNATQAAKEAENKYVMLEAKCVDDILNIIISNTYKGEVKIEKVEQTGYSTKGKSHGYGIPLANEIIKKYDNIDNFCEINGIYFIQKLNIKIK